MSSSDYRIIDLFAGIGGIRLGFEKHGCKSVFSSEWDEHAKKIYKDNFGEEPFGDINLIEPKDIPDQINLDITNLEIGAEIFVKDLPLPDGAELITDSETLVVHVLQPKSSSDDELTEETEREVEVVAKGKATKEEE